MTETQRMGTLRTWMMVAMAAGLCVLAGGCATFRANNSQPWAVKPARTHDDGWCDRFLKINYYYPVRDVFDVEAWSAMCEGQKASAWNVDDDGQVATGSFFVNRDIGAISPAAAATGPTMDGLPKPPWKVIKARDTLPESFIGQDASGKRYLVKLDDPSQIEAGSAASFITTRVLWLLGYHVPANAVIAIDGTGDMRYDGRRAEASRFVDGDILGHYKFDWFRHRREMRGLRLASAWLDDVDRAANNTLLVERDGKLYYYLLDFDSTLGLWRRGPKQPWQGHRHLWDPTWAMLDVLTLGTMSRTVDTHAARSSAVGIFDTDDFDPLAWKPQHPNSAFRFMSSGDARWMARRIAQITRAQLKAIIDAAGYSNADDRAYVLKTLLSRREKIVSSIHRAPRE